MLAKNQKRQEEVVSQCVQIALSLLAFKKGLSELITKMGLSEDFSQAVYVAAFEACTKYDSNDTDNLKSFVEKSVKSFLQDYSIAEQKEGFFLQETPLGYNIKN